MREVSPKTPSSPRLGSTRSAPRWGPPCCTASPKTWTQVPGENMGEQLSQWHVAWASKTCKSDMQPCGAKPFLAASPCCLSVDWAGFWVCLILVPGLGLSDPCLSSCCSWAPCCACCACSPLARRRERGAGDLRGHSSLPGQDRPQERGAPAGGPPGEPCLRNWQNMQCHSAGKQMCHVTGKHPGCSHH